MPISAGLRARLLPWPCCALLSLLALLTSGCLQQQAASGPFPGFAEFEGEEIRAVSFAGELEVPTDSVRAVIQTRPSRCRFLFLPVCLPLTSVGRETHRLDLTELSRDVVRIQLYHRDHGYYGARVEPLVEEVDEGVSVEFFIDAGRQVILERLAVEGADSILDPEEIRDDIALREGEPFGRVNFLASADSIRQDLLQRGYAFADVLRNYSIDTIAGVAEAEFIALPGPLVMVDTVVVEGNERVSESTLRSQLTFREGDPLRTDELNESQRNLYNLAMVNFAAIRLDAEEATSDATQEVAVRVQVVEAAQYAVEASAGFGTVDCLRTSGRWTDRNFLGGGRTLDVSGSLARIGVGSPTDLGFGSWVCTPLADQGFLELPNFGLVDQVDFDLTANFQQPRILGTQNQIGVEVHSQRLSEVDAFVRESVGGRVSVARELDVLPVALTASFEVDRGRTTANPTLLCIGFDTCTEDDFERLNRYRWSNVLSVASTYDQTSQDVQGRSNGYFLRGGVDWSSTVFASDDSYVRVLGEGAFFYPVRPGWVLATNLQLGRFLAASVLGDADGYIPPERRFYSGGPNSVRGYTRNALGPTTYIQSDRIPDPIGSATGGTQMIEATVELRTPSPFLPDLVSLATFVDAGNVTAPGTRLVDRSGLRITPGAGLRFLTPVGPFRLDIAYNGYPAETGPLYLVEEGTGLILDRRAYTPDSGGFFRKFRLQFGLGQAF